LLRHRSGARGREGVTDLGSAGDGARAAHVEGVHHPTKDRAPRRTVGRSPVDQEATSRVGDVDLDRGLLQGSRQTYPGPRRPGDQAGWAGLRTAEPGPSCRTRLPGEVSVVVRPVVTAVTVVVRPIVTAVTVVVRPVVSPVTAVVPPVVSPVTAVVPPVVSPVTAVVRSVVSPVTSRSHAVVAAAVTGPVVGAVTGEGAGRDENEQGGRAGGGEGASDVHGDLQVSGYRLPRVGSGLGTTR
jgi:hypothetical protein